MAQRVQIPASSFDAFPPAAPPPQTFVAPSLPPSAGAAVPPPSFDPYALGSGAPAAPYSYTAPPSAYGAAPPYSAAPPYGAPPASAWPAAPQAASPSDSPWFPSNTPAWEQGNYGYQQQDGTVVQFQKLVQQLRVENTYLYGDGSADQFGVNRLELTSTFALPMGGSIDTPLLLTPGFAFNWFDGPPGAPLMSQPDLPPRVYDAYLDAAWYPQFTPHLGAELGVRTGVWTDFSNVSSDSVRILGRALGVVSASPNFDVLFGVVYLDRVRIKMLPAGGVRWRPNSDTDIYAVFPNPRFRRRLSTYEGVDFWWFVSGEYGGGSWTVDRGGLNDQIDYNDIRISLGMEYQTPRMRRGRFEIGYAFDREIDFRSQMPPTFKPDPTIFFRTGFDF